MVVVAVLQVPWVDVSPFVAVVVADVAAACFYYYYKWRQALKYKRKQVSTYHGTDLLHLSNYQDQELC